MASTREIRRRIRSVKNIGQITKAMELVAASKMRRAQDVALAGRRYNFTMYAMLGALLHQSRDIEHPLLRKSTHITADSRVLMVVIGPNKGLCGGLITNLLREILRFKHHHAHVDFATMGSKVRDGVIRTGGHLVADFPLHEGPKLRDVVPLTKFILQAYASDEYDSVVIANTRFINTLKQEARIHALLPLTQQVFDEAAPFLLEPNLIIQEDVAFQFEPNITSILEQLLPRFIEMTLFQSQLEALASEFSARMIAMRNAGDNARDLHDDLVLTFNQLRQASITAEVAEIASGSTL